MQLPSVLKTTNPYRNWLPVAAAVCAGVALGAVSMIVSPSITFAAAIGVALIVAILRRAEIGILCLLIATSTLIGGANDLPHVSMGVGTVYLTDVLLWVMLGWIFVRLQVEKGFRLVHTPLDMPILAFVGVGLISTALAILGGSLTLTASLAEVRNVINFLVFFVITNLVREPRQIRLLVSGIVLLGAVVAGAMAAQFLLGGSIQIVPGRVETLFTQGESASGVTQVLPPGQSLVLVAFLILLALLVVDSHSPRNGIRFFLAGVTGVGVLITFNRNFWIGVAVVLAFWIILLGGKERVRLATWGFSAVLAAIPLLLAFSLISEARTAQTLGAVVGRVSSLVQSNVLEETSLTFRYREDSYALSQMTSLPVLGLGLGAKYRPWDPMLDWEQYDGRAYIHNGHYWLILNTGFLGYFLFAAASLIFIVRGLRQWRRLSTPFERGIALVLPTTFAALAVVAIVNPIYVQWNWTPVLAAMWGINEIILRLPKLEMANALEGTSR